MTRLTPKVLALIDSRKLGGPGRGLIQVARRAGDAGFELDIGNIVYPDTGKSTEFIRAMEAASIPLSLFPQQSKWDPGPVGAVIRHLRKSGADIIQSHGYKTHVIAALASRFCRIPWVSVNHGWTNEDRAVRLYNALERLTIRYADLSVAVSRTLYEEISGLRGKGRPTEFIGNAVDIAHLLAEPEEVDTHEQLGIPKDSLVFGVFGRLSREKGQDLFIEAFSQLPESSHAILLGSGPLESEVMVAIRKFGLERRIHVAGHQTNVAPWYAAIDVLVLPSRSEGMPNVALEACGLGIPIVATTVGDVPSLVENGTTGWLVPPGSSGALAETLLEATNCRDRLRAVGKAAKRSVFREFCPDKRAMRFGAAYQSLLRDNNGDGAR